jgi:PPOX class probable F420-dependent enzyme
VDQDRALDLLAGARVARLGSIAPDGRPHLVPVTFALAVRGPGPVIAVLYTAVDAKPKSTRQLRRLDNIRRDERVAVLADHYSEDWAQLWWVRADGAAAELPASDEQDTALRLLAQRYPQYRAQPPPGPVIAIGITRLTGWAASPAGRDPD